jgi:signal transduction histidine kinase
LAVGPIVQRIRRLGDDVERAVASRYSEPIAARGDDEIADVARAFNAAGLQIREQLAEKAMREQALREFLANTTHDVMIPLTVLQGHLATLQRNAAAGAPTDAATVKAAMDEAHYMAALMHNLGVVARLDTPGAPVHRGAVDLNALVARVVARHGPIARQLEVALDSAVPEEPVVVEGDVTLLEQAVSNVVYNAIRYNRPHGHVAAILERQAPGGFRLRVIDDGPGIAEEERARIFERGVRSDAARTRSPEGQGLGLHIARRVAELHCLELRLGPSEFGGLQVDLAGARLR